MEQISVIIAIAIIFFGPMVLIGILLQRNGRNRKKAINALPDQEKKRRMERENNEAKSGIILFSILLGGALAKAGVSWAAIIAIMFGMFAILWLLVKFFDRKKQ